MFHEETEVDRSKDEVEEEFGVDGALHLSGRIGVFKSLHGNLAAFEHLPVAEFSEQSRLALARGDHLGGDLAEGSIEKPDEPWHSDSDELLST